MSKPSWIDRAAHIAEDYERQITAFEPNLMPWRDPNGRGLPHALFMARALQSKLGSDMGDDTTVIDSETKACRWLGYLQGMLVYEGVLNLQSAKEANMNSGVSK